MSITSSKRIVWVFVFLSLFFFFLRRAKGTHIHTYTYIHARHTHMHTGQPLGSGANVLGSPELFWLGEWNVGH